MKIISSQLFERFPEIKYGFSTKIGLNRSEPFFFNMSFTVGDEKDKVLENRTEFYSSFGLTPDNVAYQKQTHSDIVTVVDKGGFIGESDAIITVEKNIGLAVSSADCTAIFLYDKDKEIIAAVHSGWRGTQKQILAKTLIRMQEEFGARSQSIFAYIAPSISQMNYEVGKEVAELFETKYLIYKNNKIYLDVAGNNYDMLLNSGVPEKQIEMSNLCSFAEKDLLHSYRRDRQKSGRAFGLIVMGAK